MAADPGGAAVGSGVARCARQGVQHHNSVKGDCHELVSEEEPGEVIDPLADKRCVLRALRSLQQPESCTLLSPNCTTIHNINAPTQAVLWSTVLHAALLHQALSMSHATDMWTRVIATPANESW